MHILFRVLGLSHRLTTAFSFLFFCTFFFSFSYFIFYVLFLSFLFDSFNFPCLCSLWCIILLPSYFLALSALPGIVMPAWCCCVFGLLLSSFNFSPPHCHRSIHIHIHIPPIPIPISIPIPGQSFQRSYVLVKFLLR